MKRKRILSTVLASVIAVGVLAGCNAKPAASSAPASSAAPSVSASASSAAPSASDSAAPSATASSAATSGVKTKGLKVAAINATTDNGWRVRYENQLKEVVDKLKADGTIAQFDTFSANNDPATQSADLEQVINQNYDIILIDPISSTGLDPLIDKALAKGITYVNVDCEYDSNKILNVTTDQKYWATQGAEFVCKQMGGKGNLLIFNGIDGNSASEIRKTAFHDVLKNYPDIKVVKEVDHNWDQVQSKQLMGEIISSGVKYDGILNQEAGLGILQAIQEAKAPMPKAIGSDEEVGYLRKLAEIDKTSNVLPFYIIENPPGIGATALKMAIQLKAGKTLKDGVTSGKNNAIYVKPQWTATYDTMAKALEDTKALPETEFISTYYTDDQVSQFFK